MQFHGIKPGARCYVLLGMTQKPEFPPYFDLLIEGYHRGAAGRQVHLGHWDNPETAWQGGKGGAEEFEQAQARLDDVLIGMADLADGMAVLDVGCGFGGTLQAIDRTWRRMTLTGVNLDPRQLRICRDLHPRSCNRMEWLEADACELPFDDAHFDRVFCIEAMFHFSSRRLFFAEVARVLRPGGALVASDLVLTEKARAGGTPDRTLTEDLVAGYGPWPDLFGADCDHRALACAVGLAPTLFRNAGANTAPSHRFTAPGSTPDADDKMGRAALALKELYKAGLMTYLYLCFDKPLRPDGGDD